MAKSRNIRDVARTYSSSRKYAALHLSTSSDAVCVRPPPDLSRVFTPQLGLGHRYI